VQSGIRANLADALREQTRRLHTEVERSAMMQALLRGRLSRASYCLLLRNLQSIYAALEGALARHAAHPHIVRFPVAELQRSGPLAEDLCHLHGGDWESAIDLLPAAASYGQRLAALDRDAPGSLLAHAYVRYLGDLSGGQILRRCVADSLGLEGAAGTRFYAFGEAGRAVELARRFRAGLDALDVPAEGLATLVAEAQWGFAAHGQLFDQIWSRASA
jgi:heme oxygenase